MSSLSKVEDISRKLEAIEAACERTHRPHSNASPNPISDLVQEIRSLLFELVTELEKQLEIAKTYQ